MQSPVPSSPQLEPFSTVLRGVLNSSAVRIAVLLWILGYIIALCLARGSLPFDRPAIAQLSFATQMAAPSIGLIEIFLLMILTFFVTRKRVIFNMLARAPERAIAARETALVLGYAALGQIGGWILGPALGYRPFSFHIAGTLFDCAIEPSRGEVWVWSLYNFLIFAVLPYLFFRRRYSKTDLNLCSSNHRNDLVLILIVLGVESVFELAVFDKNLFSLSAHQMLIGGPLTFFIFFIGTVLPTMILIYAILLPRYLKLTGSAITTTLLGGLTYAAMHLVEGWSLFDTPRHTALSLIFVMLNYFGPGMIKSVLTLRTGNAWVHAISYHSVAPHLIVDSPLMVKVFAIAP
jgi:hypothetical protein